MEPNIRREGGRDESFIPVNLETADKPANEPVEFINVNIGRGGDLTTYHVKLGANGRILEATELSEASSKVTDSKILEAIQAEVTKKEVEHKTTGYSRSIDDLLGGADGF